MHQAGSRVQSSGSPGHCFSSLLSFLFPVPSSSDMVINNPQAGLSIGDPGESEGTGDRQSQSCHPVRGSGSFRLLRGILLSCFFSTIE